MWLKLAVCALIVAFGVAIGRFASHKYRQKGAFYAQFFSFNERYLNELTYQRRPLREFLLTGGFSGEFEGMLKAFEGGRIAAFKLDFVSEEERGEVHDYFSMLGRGDSRSQTEFFFTKKDYLREKKRRCGEEAKKYTDLFCKMGLLAGLAVVILIV